MEGFWRTRCSGCGQEMRIKVTESDLGRTKEVTCPKCGEKTCTTVGELESIPSMSFKDLVKRLPEEVVEAMRNIEDSINNDPEISEAVVVIQKAGMGLIVTLDLMVTTKILAQLEQRKPKNVDPKVDPDGKVASGTFTEEDRKTARETFRINLD